MNMGQGDRGLRIEKRSMEIISGLLQGRRFEPEELPVVYRVIHATGDLEFEHTIRFHPGAVASGLDAIRAGKDILVDVRMVQAGISKTLCNGFGVRVRCLIDEKDVIDKASRTGRTRAETAVEAAAGRWGDRIGIVAVGNAPTALLKVMELVRAGAFSPGLIVGVPVGFVMAAESKEELLGMDQPYITCTGHKGGSPVAASIVNALLRLA